MGSGKKQKVGTKWYWGQHLVLCHAPLDSISKIWFGEQVGWQGSATQNQTLSLNKPTLFGEEDAEGGVGGNIDVLFGSANQGTNAYLASQIGTDGPISAFRHLISLVFNQFYMGNSPYPSTVSVEAVRTQTGWDGNPIWQQALADTGNGMNAAHIIYELITSQDWGAGLTSVHQDSFIEVAQTLKNEGFGLNLFWNKQQAVEEAIKDVCKYINAVVYNDEETGLIRIRLIRNDYLADELPTLTAKHIRLARNVKRRSTADAVNTLTLTYTDPDTYNEATIVVRNAALLRAAGRIIPESVSFPMIHDANLAYQVAMRELKTLSTRLMGAEIYCDTTAGQYQPGDVLNVVLPEAGLNHVMRVISKKRGASSNPEVTLNLTEDIFSPTFGDYAPPPPSSWTPPDYTAYPITRSLIIEAPYWMLANTLSNSELNSVDHESGVVLWQAIAPSQESLSAELNYNHTNEWQFSHKASFAPLIILNQSLNKTATTASVIHGNNVELPALGQMDDELMVITNIINNEATLIRGVLDTLPQAHDDSALFYTLTDAAITAEFIQGEQVSIQALTYTPSQKLSASDATIQDIAIEARAFKPLPVTNVTINDEYWPQSITLPLTIKWSHRSRLSQVSSAGTLSSWFTDGAPEAGSITKVRILDEDLQELIALESSATTLTLDEELAGHTSLTIELTTELNGVGSHQQYTHTLGVEDI